MKNIDPSSSQEAYLYALRLLNARDYTAQRLAEKLTIKKFDESACNATLERLKTEGWLNDHRFAERFAETAVASGRFFGQRLRLEMKRRGFPGEIITAVLGQMTENHDEGAAIREILGQRFGTFCYTAADDREKRRVFSYLQRKGFGFSAIMSALKQE